MAVLIPGLLCITGVGSLITVCTMHFSSMNRGMWSDKLSDKLSILSIIVLDAWT